MEKKAKQGEELVSPPAKGDPRQEETEGDPLMLRS